MLNCPDCAATLTATEVLEGCSVSVATTGLLRHRCARCGAAAYVRMANGSLEIGTGGDGAASFRATTSSLEPELYVRRDGPWVDCWHGKVYRRFPVAT